MALSGAGEFRHRAETRRPDALEPEKLIVIVRKLPNYFISVFFEDGAAPVHLPSSPFLDDVGLSVCGAGSDRQAPL